MNQPPSLHHGSARIDFILTSRHLVPYIVAIGSLPHDFLIPSDHRPLFLDIKLEEFLHGIPYDTISHSSSSLHSDNPKAVEKYQSLVLHALNNSTIERDTEILLTQQLLHGHLTQHQIATAKTIDRKLFSIKMKAERPCKNILKTPWSPILYSLKALTYFWHSWLRQLRSHKDGSAFRKRMCPLMPILIDPPHNLIQTSLKQAQRAFQTALRTASQLRNTHLIELAALLSNTGQSSAAKTITQLHRRESVKTIYPNCHRALHKSIPSPVTHVIMTSPGGSTQSISDQLPMEAALTARNLRHFSQADGTPFASSPLKSVFGPNGTSSPTARLLRGIHQIDNQSVSEAS